MTANDLLWRRFHSQDTLPELGCPTSSVVGQVARETPSNDLLIYIVYLIKIGIARQYMLSKRGLPISLFKELVAASATPMLSRGESYGYRIIHEIQDVSTDERRGRTSVKVRRWI